MPGPKKPKNLHEGIPGEEKMLVTVFYDDEEKEINGVSFKGGEYSIASLKQQFGGEEGEIISYVTGRKYPLSLKTWSNTDPNTTKLRFVFRFTPDPAYVLDLE